LATFGRELDGQSDAIVGYDLHHVMITDPHVVATSGSDRLPILRPSDDPEALVDGTVFAISAGPPTPRSGLGASPEAPTSPRVLPGGVGAGQ
jgi:hypothetical protein